MALLNYRCPGCDAVLEFDSSSQKLSCKYCDGVFDIGDVKKYNEQFTDEMVEIEEVPLDNAEGEEVTDWTDEEAKKLKAYVCPSCAAQIVADENTAATFCIYCGNATILPKQFEGMLKPDYVIPFKINKDEAVKKLKEFYKGKKLLPDAFEEENAIQKLTGVYVPFWLFDCNTHTKAEFDATKVKTWSDSKYNYTKTDRYLVTREGDLAFNHVPADGSKKADDKYMQSIEPFDFDEIKEFNMAYLSGYLADKYDVEAKDMKSIVDSRIKNTVNSSFTGSVSGYSSVRTKSINCQIQDKKTSYAFLPVWMLNTKYNDELYTFAMNGQTGKIAGTLPIDKGKYNKYLWTKTIIIFAILTVLYLLIGRWLF
ncbi:MAG: hypothetical protein K6G26_00890 [Lachnospiraceae bacterium]|nr:hypothetical protein [Lachnospiraceae bacterium]